MTKTKFTKKKILIVEDESIIAFDLNVQLSRAGYSIVGSVDTGADAVEQALTGEQDLILMDINLKGTETGIQAALRIKEKRKIPVIFLSALTDTDTITRAQEIPESSFIQKPYSLPDLIDAINNAQ